MKRNSLEAFFKHIHPKFVPEGSIDVSLTFCMGGLATAMFLIEMLTGALLTLHYFPSISNAYPSVQRVVHFAPYGFVFRNIHYWGGQAMVILVLIHMVRVFLTQSYLSPRQLNWIIGVTLLCLVFFEDFTGYLLVWDGRAYWAWTIARNLTTKIPAVGEDFALILFGPQDIGDLCLIRLYAWHILFFPAALAFLMSLHFWKVRKDGGISVSL